MADPSAVAGQSAAPPPYPAGVVPLSSSFVPASGSALSPSLPGQPAPPPGGFDATNPAAIAALAASRLNAMLAAKTPGPVLLSSNASSYRSSNLILLDPRTLRRHRRHRCQRKMELLLRSRSTTAHRPCGTYSPKVQRTMRYILIVTCTRALQ